MSKVLAAMGVLAVAALALAGRANLAQGPEFQVAPGVVVGARVGLSLDGHAGVFVVREVTTTGWAKLELDLEFARDEAELPVLPALLDSSASALEGVDLDEARAVLDRLRGASEDLEERARRNADARVAESRANPLWVNFAALEGYVLVAQSAPAADEDR